MAYAAFHPSSIARVIQCPGSWKLCRMYPDRSSSDAAAEGTAAHWVAEQGLRGNLPIVGTIAPNGVPITEEMLEGAEMYINAIGPGPHNIEQKLTPSSDLHPELWGTPDAWSYIGGIIEISDYKFGHGYVEVFENPQLVTYACLILDQLGIDGLQEQFIKLLFRVVQPRSYASDGPVRTWECKASDIRAMRNKIKAAIVEAQSENAQCHVGKECRYCNARAYCTTLQRADMVAVDYSSQSIPMELPPTAIGLELRLLRRAADMINARLSGLEEVAIATAKRGIVVPGWRLETGLGRTRWNASVSVLEALSATMGVKLTEAIPITPKQAVKAGIPQSVVAQLSETPTGKTVLVEDDGSLARRCFG